MVLTYGIANHMNDDIDEGNDNINDDDFMNDTNNDNCNNGSRKPLP